jgi:thioredoxin reductase
METTTEGVYAIGAVRDNPRKRIVYGMSDAMTAIDQIETYLYFLK